MSKEKVIDVEKVLKEKTKTSYKFLPKFLIKWLKKKLHEDDINAGMVYMQQFYGIEFNNAVLDFFNIKIECVGLENLPKEGGVIIASNHPLGGMDGMSLIKAIGQVRGDVRFIVNDVLRNLKNYGDVFVGVNKVGNIKSRDSLQIVEQVYATDSAILVFPAGLVSRKFKKGVIRDLEWNKSFINKAIKYNKPIVPVFIEGKNSNFFYNFARWRKRLGIKANIEMLYLVDEMFKQKGNTIKIHFGKAIEPSVFYTERTPQEWTEILYNYVYSDSIMKGIPLVEFAN